MAIADRERFDTKKCERAVSTVGNRNKNSICCDSRRLRLDSLVLPCTVLVALYSLRRISPSSRQLFVGQSLSNGVADDVSQSHHSWVVDVAFVHSKDELIDITVGVFGFQWW